MMVHRVEWMRVKKIDLSLCKASVSLFKTIHLLSIMLLWFGFSYKFHEDMVARTVLHGFHDEESTGRNDEYKNGSIYIWI